MRQNFLAQFVHILTHWLCDRQLGLVREKKWALSVDHCRLQALHFSLYFNDLLSIVLGYNGSIGIQRAVVGQTWQQTIKQ